MQQRDEDGNEHIKKLHTIVRIVLLSFVLTIIIHHFIFLYHSKLLSKGVFRISRDVDERMGTKIKTPKFPGSKLNGQKFLHRTTHHQDYSVKIKPTKKYLPNFSYPIRILELNILNPKILRSSLSIEIRSTFTGVSFHPKFLNQKFAYDVLHNRKTDCRIRS